MKKTGFYAFGISFCVLCLLCVRPSFSQVMAAKRSTPKTHKTGMSKLTPALATTVPPTFDPLNSDPMSLNYDIYNHDPVLDAIYLAHLQPMNKPSEELFFGTWFPKDVSRISRVCHVNSTGKGYSGQDVHEWAFQAKKDFQLDSDELKALRSALHSLPPSSFGVPLARLLIISYRDGGAWVTRQYDRDQLPEQVQQAYRLTGETVALPPFSF